MLGRGYGVHSEMFTTGLMQLHRAGGVDANWNESQRLNVTYCVTIGFGGNYNAVVPILLCPSDPTPSNGLTAIGWSGASYAPSIDLFGNTAAPNTFGVYVTRSQFNIGNIPDGTSNTIGIVERFANFPAYPNWCNTLVYPVDAIYWGYQSDQYGSWYGMHNNPGIANGYGRFLPQIQPPLQAGGVLPPAHPYYPTTGHPVCMVLLMDGSVRGVNASLSQATWNSALQPADGIPLGSDWGS